MAFLLFTLATVVSASLTIPDKPMHVAEVPNDQIKSIYWSPKVEFEDAVLYIGVVQSKILGFLDQSDIAGYRQGSRALRGSIDAHRPQFFLTSPGVFARKHAHVKMHRSLPYYSQSIVREVSESFAASMKEKGTLRILLNDFELDRFSLFQKSFWERFFQLELFVDCLSWNRKDLSIFHDLNYDIVMTRMYLFPDTDGHFETLFKNAKRIKRVYLTSEEEFNLWKPYATKTDIAFSDFPLKGHEAQDIMGFLAEVARTSQLLWIAQEFTPEMSDYLSGIHSFGTLKFQGGSDVDPAVWRKCDELRKIHVTYSGVSLDAFLTNADPDIEHTLTELIAEGFEISEGLSDAAVRILRQLRRLDVNGSADMDLTFVSRLPYLRELAVTTDKTGRVRLPRTLRTPDVYIHRATQIVGPVTLTAETLYLSHLHPTMQFQNTVSLTIQRLIRGSMEELLEKLPSTLVNLAIPTISQRDRALLQEALKKERWSHLQVTSDSLKP